ncbi:hypothetical protein Tco_0072168 [Tanacetum coccineum]
MRTNTISTLGNGYLYLHHEAYMPMVAVDAVILGVLCMMRTKVWPAHIINNITTNYILNDKALHYWALVYGSTVFRILYTLSNKRKPKRAGVEVERMKEIDAMVLYGAWRRFWDTSVSR